MHQHSKCFLTLLQPKKENPDTFFMAENAGRTRLKFFTLSSNLSLKLWPRKVYSKGLIAELAYAMAVKICTK